MNICFLLVLSLTMQYLFSFLIKLLLPQLAGITWFGFVQVSVISVLTVFLPAYLYLKDEKKKYFTDCFESIKINKLIPVAAVIGICGQYTGILANIPVNYLLFIIKGDISNNIPNINSPALFLAGIFVLCLLPAVFEEILFRGIVFNHFRQYGTKAAIIISAFLFALMHLDYTNLLGTFTVGIICGIMVRHTNRIIYPMIAHFFVNFVSVISTYITQFEVAQSIYNDLFYMFILVSVPLLIFLMGIFKQNSEKYPYADEEKHIAVTEHIIELDEENSIKIIEHDVRENNIKMAFKSLLKSPYFYILLILFLVIGGFKL